MQSPEELRRHIEVLTDFEVKYAEMIGALEGLHRTGRKRWSEEEFARRKREIQKDSVRADAAMKASGVGQLVFTEAPALGGGVRAADLPSQVFDFIEAGGPFTNDDGLSFQRGLLERMPSQLAGLELRLEEAEAKRAKRPKLIRESPFPRLFSRIGGLPPWLGFAADLITVVGFVIFAIAAAGHFTGLW
jgi:hypothetical protein